jgi:hypothetical protein
MKPGSATKPESGMQPDADGKYRVSVDANGYPDDMTAHLFPVVGGPPDWNNPELRRLGEKFAAEAYTLADELHSCGADPEQLLLHWRQRRARPFRLEVQPELLDAVAAVLLSLPRPTTRPGPRSRWTIRSVETMIKGALLLSAAVKAEAARTGAKVETIERAMYGWLARNRKQREAP